MRTRCPGCGTVFRVTSEQLRLKAGKVRCGQCQQVFNAFDHLQTGTPPNTPPQIASAAEAPALEQSPVDGADNLPSQAAFDPEATIVAPDFAELDQEGDHASLAAPEIAHDIDSDIDSGAPREAASAPPATVVPSSVNFDETLLASPAALLAGPADEISPGDALAPQDDSPPAVEPESAAAEPPMIDQAESAEVSTQAARDAGLVSVRELNETPAFNRWAAGTLASDGVGGFEEDSARRPVWLFVLISLLLALGLAAQLLYAFRTQVVLRLPSFAALYAMAEIEAPLPRHVERVAIESSELQYDNGRNLFVLQVTLRNRADYVQAWPALELTLTDTNDSVVARRVIPAPQYLPPGLAQDNFAANREVALRLWIDAKDLGAVGYRLYIFYP